VVEERRGRYFLARAIWSNLTQSFLARYSKRAGPLPPSHSSSYTHLPPYFRCPCQPGRLSGTTSRCAPAVETIEPDSRLHDIRTLEILLRRDPARCQHPGVVRGPVFPLARWFYTEDSLFFLCFLSARRNNKRLIMMPTRQ
jgi:hypothetical protein